MRTHHRSRSGGWQQSQQPDAATAPEWIAGRLPDGATVVLTAGRRTGTPGATNLIMVREIP